LPASRGNVIRQSFKFLGERYGWGHDYNGRDCSGFVSEVYRSLGILLPRNTGDQQRSMNFKREAFAPELSRAQRIARLQQLQIGDLVFIPGHVMLVIGFDEHGPWVIHDANKSGVIIDGRFQSLASNSVIVTPLLPLALSGERLYADAVTAIQRILPGSP
jgi:cell wall-associated NlpC family hydrolase